MLGNGVIKLTELIFVYDIQLLIENSPLGNYIFILVMSLLKTVLEHAC